MKNVHWIEEYREYYEENEEEIDMGQQEIVVDELAPVPVNISLEFQVGPANGLPESPCP